MSNTNTKPLPPTPWTARYDPEKQQLYLCEGGDTPTAYVCGVPWGAAPMLLAAVMADNNEQGMRAEAKPLRRE